MCGDLNRIREEAVQEDWVRISARIPLVGVPVFRAGSLPGPAQTQRSSVAEGPTGSPAAWLHMHMPPSTSV